MIDQCEGGRPWVWGSSGDSKASRSTFHPDVVRSMRWGWVQGTLSKPRVQGTAMRRSRMPGCDFYTREVHIDVFGALVGAARVA